LRAWTNAFALASDDLEREGVHVHFARTKLNAGRFEEARQHLALVTNTTLAEVKKRVARNLAEQEQAAKTNNPAANTTSPSKP
jgi:thioredoxin-like negative regulator of GroEL